QPAKGQKYALLIGVRKYTSTELTPLEYTENDVRVLAGVLRGAGFKRVVLMTQKDGAEEPRYLPKAPNIRRELKTLLQNCKPRDTVIVAVCGHGVQFRGSDEPYFCPMDTALKNKKTLISLSEVYQALSDCKAKTKVLFSDSCRNDPLPSNTRTALGKQIFAPTDNKRKTPPRNVIAVFSCAAAEVAYESAKLKHGVFFHFLIEGLRGKAAPRNSTEVSLGALVDYVQREVRGYVKKVVSKTARQQPEVVGRWEGVVKLLTIGKVST